MENSGYRCYSGGADYHNIDRISRMWCMPVTVATWKRRADIRGDGTQMAEKVMAERVKETPLKGIDDAALGAAGR